MRTFATLSEREILALAISLEEDGERTCVDYAERLRENFPESAAIFDGKANGDAGRRRRLIDLYRQRFGYHIPLIRPHNVTGFVTRKSAWLTDALGPEKARKQHVTMEIETRRFYRKAAERAEHLDTRRVLLDLASEKRERENRAEELEEGLDCSKKSQEGAASRRLFVLEVVQPGVAAMMNVSVSTLAPVFAAAFATHTSRDAFVVGLAASLGGGISVGFAEALYHDGSLTGRGRPWVRGLACGLMTALGSIGHTLPFLISEFHTAITAAIIVVLVELDAIAWARYRYLGTPPLSAALQVGVGGALVFLAGVLIGSA